MGVLKNYTDMETTSTLSQELIRAAVTAEPEIAKKVQALVETMEGMIRSKQDAGEFAGLEQLAEDGRVMRFVADTLNKLPEAVTYSDKGFEAYVMLVALSREDAALRYVFRLSSWYINYGCNRELLYLCRILHIYPERGYLNLPFIHKFRLFFYLCMMLLETDQIRDPRLLRRLNLICSQMVVHQSAIVNQFCKEHKDKMGAYRFLNNSSVTSDAILSGLIQTCYKNASGCEHLLCIQDTSEINYEAHVERMKKKTASPGIVGQKQCGSFLHPVLVVDASSHIPIGFSSVKQWNRSSDALSREERNYRYQPIEEKSHIVG